MLPKAKAKHAAVDNRSWTLRSFIFPDHLLPFDQEDIAANRQGLWSQHQQSTLRTQWKDSASTILTFVVLGTVLIIGLSLAFYSEVCSTVFSLTGLYAGFVLIWQGVISTRQLLNAELEDTVVSQTGKIHVALAEDQSRQTKLYNFISTRNPVYTRLCRLSINKETFYILDDLPITLKYDGVYTVYYTPNLKIFLSIEPADVDHLALSESSHHTPIVVGDDGEIIVSSGA